MAARRSSRATRSSTVNGARPPSSRSTWRRHVTARPAADAVLRAVRRARDQGTAGLVGARAGHVARRGASSPASYPIKRGETIRSVIERAGGADEPGVRRGKRVHARGSARARTATAAGALRAHAARPRHPGAAGQPELAAGGAAGDGHACRPDRTCSPTCNRPRPSGASSSILNRCDQLERGSSDDIILKDGDRADRAQAHSGSDGDRRGSERDVARLVARAVARLLRRAIGRRDQAGGQQGDLHHPRERQRRRPTAAAAGLPRRQTRTCTPGDTIVVPLDVERMRPLPLWAAVTTIIYNLAVAVAAVNSF